MNIQVPYIVWHTIFPVILMTLTGIIALLAQMFGGKKYVPGISLVGTAFSVVSLFWFSTKFDITFGEMIRFDHISFVGQVAVLLSTLIVLLISPSYMKQRGIQHSEFYPLALWASVGSMLLCSSRNLLVIFLAIEVLSICLYVLAGLARGQGKSEESAMKYFLLGAFATGFFLYGIAFFYGATGNLELSTALNYARRPDSSAMPLISIAFALMTVGFGFKASMAPFHQWTPDVYEGAPTNVVAFMATVGKVGVFVAFWNFADSFGPVGKFVFGTLAILSVLSMIIGNVMAMIQKNLKRLLAYSSVANAGYFGVMAATVAADSRVASYTLAYFLVGYTLTTLGVFTVLTLLAKEGKEVTTVDDLKGLAKQSPLAAGTLLVCVLSLIGLGPVSGFVGKLFIIENALKANLLPLVIIFVLNSVFGAFYYFGLVKAAYQSSDTTVIKKPTTEVNLALGICAVAVVASVIFVTPMMSFLGYR